MYKVRENLEAAVLGELYLDLIKTTGSVGRTDELMREAAQLIGSAFTPLRLAGAVAVDRNSLLDSIKNAISHTASQGATTTASNRATGDSEKPREERQKQSAAETGFYSGLVKLARPFAEELLETEIGPDREFWQMCRGAGIQPMIEFLLPAPLVQELVVQLNDQSDRVARLVIAETAFEMLWKDYTSPFISDTESHVWGERYLRLCRYLGGYISSSQTNPTINFMLQFRGHPVEFGRWLRDQRQKEGLKLLK